LKHILPSVLAAALVLASPAVAQDTKRETPKLRLAVGGTSVDAHLTGLRRVEQAGAQLTSIPQLLCELQRDGTRKDTVPAFVKLLFK
jgi:hypothetical protein